ncbi:diadenylate cyclase [Desulfitispora alkaliphila]|uniref:DNA integrity scanning diadenylate cyclase DisA n=1 Tax=Desulfitispora alkaliphila TaxID=622674 RepID=UPI003D1A00A7
MSEERDESFIKVLKTLAPGTVLRDGLENVLRAKTGALIAIGDSEELMDIVEGGFNIDCAFTPANLYELAKMDGAIILNRSGSRILKANTQLSPQSNIPSKETGIRHRTAERTAKQTGELVISISQRRGVITIYKGDTKYVLRDIGVILTKANQAIQTLEKYKTVLDKALSNLTILEFEDIATVYDVVRVVQRLEMVMRIVKEIEIYISELGNEGRLVSMQLEELVSNVEEEGTMLINDYYVPHGEVTVESIKQIMQSWTSEELLDLTIISRALGFGGTLSSLDLPVTPRGYRILQKIPRLPHTVVENLTETFGAVPNILQASIEELDDVEGIGEVRARAIKDGLKRLREQVLLDRNL